MTAGRRRPLAVVAMAIALAACLAPTPAVPRTLALLPLHANDDTLSTRHDRVATVAAPGVLGNDLNILGGTTAVLDSTTTHGNLVLAANGGYTYTPVARYVGTDVFRYHDSGILPSNSATVTITVTNAAPVASNDAYSMAMGTTLVVAAPGVLANDSDADGDGLTASLVDGSGTGTVNVGSNGAITVKPGGSFTGVRTFTYRVSDGLAFSNVATVSVTVNGASSTPTPTPTPRPTPTPTPSPTPRPTIPLPSLPLPSLPLPLPSPSIPPLPQPTLVPTPTPTPSPRGSASPGEGPLASTGPPDAPSERPSGGPSGAPVPGAAGGVPPPGGDSGVGDGGSAPEQPFVVGGPDHASIDGLDGVDIAGFGGAIDWAVPSLVLSVPGLLLVLAVAAQAVGGVVWIPLVRRWLGAFGVRRRDRQRGAPG